MICFFAVSGIASAYDTDDAKVLDGLSTETDLYEYLSDNDYSIWMSDHRYSKHDMYINDDDSVIIDTWEDTLGHVFLLKPGYTTDKGIAVGMSMQDIANAYGQYDEMWGNDTDYYKDYSGYITLEYVSASNEGLSFVLNKYTNEIVLIRYQANRHGNTLVMADVKKYNMLPFLK